MLARKLGNFLVRITLGIIFIITGLGKLFFGAKPPIEQIITFLPAETSILILGIIELAVGLLLFLGLFTKFAGWISALLYLSFVLGGLFLGLFMQSMLIKDVALLAASLEIAWTGARMWGIDSLF